MSNLAAFAVIVAAALLESGGDALVRTGLHASGLMAKATLILFGGVVLLTYGVAVNSPPWDFGRLLGVYVAMFFVAAQAINFFAFHVSPTLPVVLGGALIVSGGLLMTVWR